jgi:hypothetical protein
MFTIGDSGQVLTALHHKEDNMAKEIKEEVKEVKPVDVKEVPLNQVAGYLKQGYTCVESYFKENAKVYKVVK